MKIKRYVRAGREEQSRQHSHQFSGKIISVLKRADGKVLKEEKLQAVTGNDLQKQLNVTGIPGGMYFLIAIDASGSRQTIKLVIAH